MEEVSEIDDSFATPSLPNSVDSIGFFHFLYSGSFRHKFHRFVCVCLRMH